MRNMRLMLLSDVFYIRIHMRQISSSMDREDLFIFFFKATERNSSLTEIKNVLIGNFCFILNYNY